jgi:hypothetical protein
LFRQRAAQETKVLIFNEGTSTDALLSRILDLQVRTPQRLCVLDSSSGSGKTTHFAAFISSILRRLAVGLEAGETEGRILNASIENGMLRVISPDFERVDVPIAQVPALNTDDPSKVTEFEIDEDGAFIYWPKLDVSRLEATATVGESRGSPQGIPEEQAVQQTIRKSGAGPARASGLTRSEIAE